MSDQTKLDKDGLPQDDVSHYFASAQDMQTFRDASQALSKFQSPVLMHAGDPHERLYVAALDGTGNDKYADPQHATSVARISDQINAIMETGYRQIAVGYVEGPGTQSNPITQTLDGALGYTHTARVERMYQLFIDQAWQWKQEDSHAKISVADIGFSRGAEEAASFARLVHERGIQDPAGAVYTRNHDGQITHVHYSRPPLVEPGQVAQAVGLFDAVATGEPSKHDRRLPPSVISGVQIIAKDEHRGLFPSNHVIDPGLSEDGRFLGVILAGAHSDIGNSYLLNGLGARSGNFMVDYLNSLSDKPFLEKQVEPSDPRLNVVHRSEEGMPMYRVGTIDRLKPEGYDELLVPIQQAGHVPDPRSAEPRDEALNAQFEHKAVTIGPVPPDPALAASESQLAAKTDARYLFDQMLDAMKSGNDIAFRAAILEAADTDAARAMRAAAIVTVDQQERMAAEQLAAHPAVVPPQSQAIASHR